MLFKLKTPEICAHKLEALVLTLGSNLLKVLPENGRVLAVGQIGGTFCVGEGQRLQFQVFGGRAFFGEKF